MFTLRTAGARGPSGRVIDVAFGRLGDLEICQLVKSLLLSRAVSTCCKRYGGGGLGEREMSTK
jgi:hypothetical protein